MIILATGNNKISKNQRDEVTVALANSCWFFIYMCMDGETGGVHVFSKAHYHGDYQQSGIARTKDKGEVRVSWKGKQYPS